MTITGSDAGAPEHDAAPDIVAMDAVALSAAIQARTVSCTEVMRAFLDWIDRQNPRVNAIVSRPDPAVLLAEAAARDRQLARGDTVGWMHGLPHAVKDTAMAAGLPGTMGSPILRDTVPAEDGLMVSRLRAAGAIFIGKTNVPEFGLGSHSFNPVFGTTSNPYAPGRSAGGSSGGAAAALALRMVPVADGSDFGGSLRNPAGWNNVFGLRPTIGRIPYNPASDLFVQQLTTEGPMARSVDDLAMLLSVQAGPAPQAPLSLPEAGSSFARPPERHAAGLRIGWLGDAGGLPMEPGILATCEMALAAFAQAGARVEPATLPLSREAIWDTWLVHRHWLVTGALMPWYENPAHRALLKPEAIWEIEGGLRLSAQQVYRASLQRSALYRGIVRLFERFDLLALPTAQLFPFDAAQRWPTAIGGVAMDTYHRWMEVVVAATLSGCPVLGAPAGFGGAADLPIGIQLIAPRGADLALLAAGRAFERATAALRNRTPFSPKHWAL